MFFKKLFFISLLVILLPGCWDKHNSDKNKLLVLNILDSELYQDCHISGSLSVPLDDLETYVRDLDVNREIIVYCSNYLCTASAYAAELLQKLGFKQVYAYEAGLAEWHQRGLPTIGSAQQRYLNIVVAPPKESDINDHKIKIITTEALAAKMGLKLS
jgi:rhodanese-related sulfurtransferase